MIKSGTKINVYFLGNLQNFLGQFLINKNNCGKKRFRLKGSE
jgi:hypothetical protein